MRLNPTCCFPSCLGKNLLEQTKLRVATVSLFAPAAVATECEPCSRPFFFPFSRLHVLALMKRRAGGVGRGGVSLELAAERHLRCGLDTETGKSCAT